MSAITDPPSEGFRLSQLIYDSRYRSMTIQIIALIGFLLAGYWLVGNAAQNLSDLGKPLGFDFFSQPASYDINQRLIDYDSRDSHLRAAMVGLLNTLLVAFLGCIAATILGVIIGVLRLSNNWLVARIMTVYIEAFRNVPLLLWIVFAMAIFTESLPAPKDFRGENPNASMLMGDSVAITNRGVYLPEVLFSNGPGDIPVFADREDAACKDYFTEGDTSVLDDSCGVFQISMDLMLILAVLAAGIFTAWAIKRWADQTQAATGFRPTTWWKRLAVIAIPMGILLWVMGTYLGYPELKGFNFKGGTYLRNSLIALWFALSFYTAAFIAENVRAGIMAVSKGQSEAAFALGMRPSWTMNLVILPQALRVIIPPLISQYLNLTKNSSLAIAVGYMDITGTLGGITLNQTGREMETLLILMAIYLIISLTISTVMNWYNESVKLRER